MKLSISRPVLHLDSPLLIKPCPSDLAQLIDKRCKRANPVYLALKSNNPYGNISSDVESEIEFGWSFLNEAFLSRGALEWLPEETQQRIRKFKRKNSYFQARVKFPVPKLDPNKEQAEAMKAVRYNHKNGLKPAGNYLLLASTSVGKTILQALVAMYFGQRTLVMCPTMLIMSGWVHDLIKLFNFTSKEIGVIQQKKWEIGEQFTVASNATIIRRKESWDEINSTFGTVIVDEADSVAAPSLLEFVKQCKASYLVGATATATDRVGNANIFLEAMFGNPVITLNTYGKETQNSMSIDEVKIIETDLEYDVASDSIDWLDFSMTLMLDEHRNELIAMNVKKEWEQGRVILLVTRRVEHLDILQDILLKSGVTNVNEVSGRTNVNKKYLERLVRSVSKRRSTCIIATMQAIQTGANIPSLDSLHITMPLASTKNLEQLVGRIRRRSDGKLSAKVTYYLDKNIGYATHLFRRVIIPTFRRMKVPGFNIY